MKNTQLYQVIMWNGNYHALVNTEILTAELTKPDGDKERAVIYDTQTITLVQLNVLANNLNAQHTQMSRKAKNTIELSDKHMKLINDIIEDSIKRTKKEIEDHPLMEVIRFLADDAMKIHDEYFEKTVAERVRKSVTPSNVVEELIEYAHKNKRLRSVMVPVGSDGE